jgi:hypothetical protein
MADTMDWIAVEKFSKLIGAVGFIDNDAVAVAAFYDDADADKDGKVSTGEWIGSKILFNVHGMAVTEVAMQARVELDIVGRDPNFNAMALKMFVNFAQGLIAQGIYITYFSRGVSLAGSGLASTLTSSMIKQLVIRKGFESAVKKVFMKGVGY